MFQKFTKQIELFIEQIANETGLIQNDHRVRGVKSALAQMTNLYDDEVHNAKRAVKAVEENKQPNLEAQIKKLTTKLDKLTQENAKLKLTTENAVFDKKSKLSELDFYQAKNKELVKFIKDLGVVDDEELLYCKPNSINSQKRIKEALKANKEKPNLAQIIKRQTSELAEFEENKIYELEGPTIGKKTFKSVQEFSDWCTSNNINYSNAFLLCCGGNNHLGKGWKGRIYSS